MIDPKLKLMSRNMKILVAVIAFFALCVAASFIIPNAHAAPALTSLAPIRTLPSSEIVNSDNITTAGWVDGEALSANTPVSHTIPAGATFVNITCSTGTDIWVNMGGTAAIPGASIVNGTASILNPAIRTIGSATSIGLVSPSTTKCSLEFFKH
jgi:hypothetical protein